MTKRGGVRMPIPVASAVLAVALLGGCSKAPAPSGSGAGTMPPNVAQEYNQRMQQAGGSQSGPGSGAPMNPGMPAGVPSSPGMPAGVPIGPGR